MEINGKEIIFNDKVNIITFKFPQNDPNFNHFVNLANRITNESIDRKSRSSNNSKSKNDNSANPIRLKFNKLKEIVKIREEQLSKMSKNDPNRKSLENELNSYKDKISQMKKQYQFEHMISFSKFKLV